MQARRTRCSWCGFGRTNFRSHVSNQRRRQGGGGGGGGGEGGGGGGAFYLRFEIQIPEADTGGESRVSGHPPFSS